MRRPPGGAGSGTAATDGRLMSIGAALALLREKFPEVTISKIRFLEAEGLVVPQRTPSGYRKFSPRDVERLGQVLRMQRDHYLPLKVIREHLDALDAGRPLPLPARPAHPAGAEPGLGALGGPRGPVDEAASAAPRVGRAELLAAAGADEAELAEWEAYGLVEADAEGRYDAETVTIATLVRELRSYGVEPRHLRSAKAAADRDVSLVEQVVAPLRRHRNPQTRAHAEATARELADLSVRLYAALVRSALRQGWR